MKKLSLVLILVFSVLITTAQTWTNVNGRWQYQYVRFDNTVGTFTPPLDTLPGAPIGSVAVKNDVPYFKHSSGFWLPITGSAANLATTNLVATGNYSHNWKGKNLNIDSIGFLGFTGYGNYFGGPQRVQYNFVPSSFTQAVTIAHTIRNAANTSDSATRSIVFNAGGINETVTASGKTSSIILGDNAAGQTVTIMGADSTYIGKAVAKTTADSVFAVGPLQNSGKTNVLYKIPASGLSGKNLATAPLTATGDYIHNWANHQLYIDTLKAYQFKYYTDGVSGYAGRKRTGYYQWTGSTGHQWYDVVRNVSNNSDSLSLVVQARPEWFTAQTSSGFNTTSNFFVTNGLVQQQAVRLLKQTGTYVYTDSVVFSTDSNSVNLPLNLRLRNLQKSGSPIYNLSVNSNGDVIAARNTIAACSVKDNGADTTGTTDVSGIVQAMVNNGCKNIKFPAGNYLFTNTVQLKDSVTISGDGKASVIKLGRNKPGFRCGFTNGQWCTFRDFSITGSYSDSSSQEGIHADSCKGIYVNNVYFFKTGGPAIHFYRNKSSTEANTILGCYADSCKIGFYTDIAEFNKITCNTIAYCDTGLKINSGNVIADNNNITRGSIGVYLSGHSAIPAGDFNDGHTVMTGNLIAHNTYAGLFCDGVTNGEQFGHNIIRNNGIYDIYAQNSDNLWFDNNDLGIDTLAFINCTNTNLSSTNKFWNVTVGRPGPPDQFGAWKIVGTPPTVAGSGWAQNTLSLYDVQNNKRFDISHTNNTIDISTTNTGKIRTSDSLITPVLAGGELVGSNIKIYATTNSNKTGSKIYLGDSSVYDPSVPKLGINNINPVYMLDMFKTSGTLGINTVNLGPTSLSFLRFKNDANNVAQFIFGGSGSAPFVPNGGLLIDGQNYFGICSENGQISFGNSTTLNGYNEHARFTNNHHFLIGSITDNGHVLQVNGAVTINKDSVPIITTPTTQYQVLIDTVTGQIERKTLRQQFTQTADVVVNGTSSETTLVGSGVGSLVIPANTLVAGKSYRVTVRGKYNTDASNPAQMNWKVKLGGSVIAASGNAGLGTNKVDKGYDVHCEFTCRTTGTTGSVMGQGMFFTEDGPGAKSMTNGFAATTINTTISNTVDVTVTLTDSSSGNSCYAYMLIFEEI